MADITTEELEELENEVVSKDDNIKTMQEGVFPYASSFIILQFRKQQRQNIKNALPPVKNKNAGICQSGEPVSGADCQREEISPVDGYFFD